jgi:hypothetical protein
MEDSAAQYRAGLREWLHTVDEADRRFFMPPAGASAKEVDKLVVLKSLTPRYKSLTPHI